MTKSRRNLFVWLFSLVFAFSLAITALPLASRAAHADATCLDGVTYKMLPGAYIRANDAATSGLRFVSYLDKTTYNALENNADYDVSYGMIIAPVDYASENVINEDNVFGEDAVYYGANYKGDKTGKKEIINLAYNELFDASELITADIRAIEGGNADYACFCGVIYEILEENYLRGFVGVGYIKAVSKTNAEDVDYLFVSTVNQTDNARSVAYTAQRAKAAAGDELTETLQAILDNYIESEYGYGGTSLTVGTLDTVYVGEGIDLSTLTDKVNTTWTVTGLAADKYTLVNGVLTITAKDVIGNTFTLTANATSDDGAYAYPAQSIENITVVSNGTPQNEIEDIILAYNREYWDSIPVSVEDNDYDVKFYVNGEENKDESLINDGGTVILPGYVFDVPGEYMVKIELVDNGDVEFTYEFNVITADRAIGSVEEFEDWYNNYSSLYDDKLLIVLTDDIILDENTTYNNGGKSFYSWGGIKFNGTIDGRGYKISNFKAQKWLIPNLAADGVVKNLTMDNMTITGSDSFLSVMLEGTVQDCYFQGTNNNAANGISAQIASTAQIVNTVIDMSVANGTANYAVTPDFNAGATVSGVYVINDNYFAVCGGDSGTDFNVYASLADMKEEVIAVPSGFSSDWIYDADKGLITRAALR